MLRSSVPALRRASLLEVLTAIREHEVSHVLKARRAPRNFPAAHVHVVGVDEVGTGAIAGPIIAAAAYVPPHVFVPGLTDSKRMDSRDELLEVMARLDAEPDVLFGTYGMTAAGIRDVGQGLAIDNVLAESLNRVIPLAAAAIDAQYALDKPFADVAATDRKVSDKHASKSPVLGAIFDGDRVPFGAYGQQSACAVLTSLPRADLTCPSVAAASVVAKVMRDSKMLELDAAYPEYGFADHKGYATERHLEAIRVHGECPEHRTVPADDADVDAEEELKAAKAVLSAISAERIAAKRQAAAAMRSRSPSATVRGTRTARTSRRAGF